MTYSTLENLIDRFGEQNVRVAFAHRFSNNSALPDDPDDPDPDGRTLKLFVRVDRRIDGYLRDAGISVPFVTVPSQIQDIAEQWYMVEGRRDGGGGITREADDALEAKLIERLTGIGEGKEILDGIDIASNAGAMSSVTDGRAAPFWSETYRDELGNVTNPVGFKRLDKIL